MRYNAATVAEPWVGTWPDPSTRSEKISLMSARQLLRDARAWDELVNRSERDYLTEVSMRGVERNLPRRLANTAKDLARCSNAQIRVWLHAVLDHAKAVYEQNTGWQPPNLSISCDWKPLRGGRYAEATEVFVSATPQVDVRRISRNLKNGQVRITTDGDNLHRGNLYLNTEGPLELVERGRSGTLFIYYPGRPVGR